MEAGPRSKIDILITKLEDVSFILTNNVGSPALFNATNACLPMFTTNICGCCPEFAEDIPGN